MFYNVKESKIKVSNYEIDYITFGYGNKPLIMIQGLNTNNIKGNGLSLAYMYRLFVKEYKVYLFDRRPYVDNHITVKDIALDIACAMDQLNIKNADVLGVSQGGMIGQYLALERSDLVRKLVLAFTLSKNNDTVIQVINDWISMVKTNQMKQFVYDIAYKMYSSQYIKRYQLFLPLLVHLQKPKDINRFIALASSCLTCHTYDSLHLIKCPTLVIGAKKDQIVGCEASYELAEKLGCEIYMYEDLGHGAYEEAKDFNQIVYRFFSR